MPAASYIRLLVPVTTIRPLRSSCDFQSILSWIFTEIGNWTEHDRRRLCTCLRFWCICHVSVYIVINFQAYTNFLPADAGPNGKASHLSNASYEVKNMSLIDLWTAYWKLWHLTWLWYWLPTAGTERMSIAPSVHGAFDFRPKIHRSEQTHSGHVQREVQLYISARIAGK